MCGLFASIGFTPDPARIDIVAHRGPDGRGWRVFDSPAGPVALGHRRLAIIDVSDAGLQPMSDDARDGSGQHWLVFNGEIYNYLELRAELQALGHRFTTESDSEVLLAAFSQWGEAALPRLRGMFAFLIWDQRTRQLFAARDRFGIKPLYLAETPAGIAFASEIKQLHGLPGLSGRMNLARVRDFLADALIDHTDETLFDGVRQLQGGECAVVDCAGPRPMLTVRRWYRAQRGDIALSETDAAARFRALMEESVRLHLRSDVPVGSCLSGGLDSSSIVCLMSAMMGAAMDDGARVNTVSACYADKSVDEKPFMDAVVAHAGTEPHFIWPKPEDVFARASDITWHQDEPFGSTSIFAQWCVFEEARRVGVKVMLDGQGADEQLAGYHTAFGYRIAGLIRQGRFGEVVSTLRARAAMHGASPLRDLALGLVPLLPRAASASIRARRRALFQNDWLGRGLVAAADDGRTAAQAGADRLGLPPVTDIASLCLSMTFTSNLPMLLHWEDRNSMAHGIEARVPFLDHPLVEFSLALGNEHKIVGADTKRVLRQAMSGVLPDAVRDRRDKLGFATPEEAWFRGPLKGLIRDGVETTLALYPDLVNAAGVRALTDDMLEGRRKLDFALWRIVNLGLWGERFRVGL